jgi:hypothetical protein
MMGKKPTFASDYYSVGALALAYLLPVNSISFLWSDACSTFLRNLEKDCGISAALVEKILQLLTENEEHRTTIRPLQSCLENSDHACFSPSQRAYEATENDNDETGIAAYVESLLQSANYSRKDRLFPGDAKGFQTNHLGIAHGACGVIHVLHQITGEVPAAMMNWVLERRFSKERLSPGLYVGLSGIAWALLETRAVEEATKILSEADDHPVLLDRPDLFYGASGWGLAQLRFFIATQDERYLDNARSVYRHLLETSKKNSRGRYWEIEEETPIGFAYGASGIALFLLYLYLVVREERVLQLGLEALEFDLYHGTETQDGGLSWPAEVELVTPLYPYWRYGTAGVVKSLVRYNQVLKDQRYRSVLDKAFIDLDRKYALYPGYANGLAGICDALIDLYQATGEEKYRKAASKTLSGIRLFTFEHQGKKVVPGDGLMRISYDFASGLAGIAMVIDRYVNDKISSFSLDQLLDWPQATAAQAA